MSIIAATAESTDTFADQVLPYARQLRSAALRLTGNAADADALVQETYEKASAGFATFRPGTNLRAGLHRIQENTFYGACRTRGRRPRELPLDALSALAERADFGSSAEDVALARMTDPALKEAVRELPEHLAITVYLADAQGFRYAEIAEITGVPLGTVMSRLHRGRRRLRALLLSTCRETGRRVRDLPITPATLLMPDND